MLRQDNRPSINDLMHAAGLPDDVLVSPDNFQILVSRSAILVCSNIVSAYIGRNLRSSEAAAMKKMMEASRGTRYAGVPVSQALSMLATDYMQHMGMLPNRGGRPGPQTNETGYQPGGLGSIAMAPWQTEAGTRTNGDAEPQNALHEYQRAELEQLTKDETPYKMNYAQNRRGDAIVDRARVSGHNSSPHDLPPLSTDDVQRVLHESHSALLKIIDPVSWPETMQKFRDSYPRTLLDINLPHQTALFDSRNCDPVRTAVGQFGWNIHTAGNVGAVGNVRTNDTLQQIITFQFGDFWIPLAPDSVYAAYRRIQVCIPEFSAQAIPTLSWTNPNVSNQAFPGNYHLSFDITEFVAGRAHLVPSRDGLYKLRAPHAILNSFTVQFTTMNEPIVFDPQFAEMNMTYGNPTTLTAALIPHQVLSGDLVYIISSNSGSAAIDRTLMFSAGYRIIVIDQFSFTIAVDTSVLVGSQLVDVYFGAKRISFDVLFTSIEQ